MASQRWSLKRAIFLTLFIAICLFATAVKAQDNADEDTTTTTANTNNNNDEDTTTTTTANNNDNEDTTTTTAETTSSTTTQASITATGTGTTEGNTATSSIPSITGSTTQAASAGPSDLPTLTGAYNTYSYPPPSVPPTANAPFMQTSSLPDGTVFIAVGAILGAFGAAVLIYRGIVACLLHRRADHANATQHINDKSTFPALPAQFYKYSDHQSSASLAAPNRRTNRGPIPSATPSQTNLFFSPTAPGAGQQARDSRASFLPNGFYPAGGSVSPQNGMGHQNTISLSNLRPSSRGQVASYAGPSPPDSPAFGPSRSNPALRNVSSSSLNRPPSQRAPSAYLEDLLDENPNAFPPQGQMPPMPHHPSQYGQGRM